MVKPASSATSVSAVRGLAHRAPLHELLMIEVKRRLHLGEWPVGSRMPTEAELSAEYEVSRATVRMAIKLLQAQGLVDTRHGAGTFVAPLGGKVRAGLEQLRSTLDTIRMQGFEPGVLCRLVEERRISPECAEAFALSADTGVIYIERAILADDQTVAFCYEEIVGGLLPGPIEVEHFSSSLFELLRRVGNVVPTHAVAEIHAVYDSSIGWGSHRPAIPLYLLLRQAHFTAAGAPVIFSRNFFVEGLFDFSLVRRS